MELNQRPPGKKIFSNSTEIHSHEAHVIEDDNGYSNWMKEKITGNVERFN